MMKTSRGRASRGHQQRRRWSTARARLPSCLTSGVGIGFENANLVGAGQTWGRPRRIDRSMGGRKRRRDEAGGVSSIAEQFIVSYTEQNRHFFLQKVIYDQTIPCFAFCSY
jgi:hypothetical protein